jgi:hypothetical protein
MFYFGVMKYFFCILVALGVIFLLENFVKLRFYYKC